MTPRTISSPSPDPVAQRDTRTPPMVHAALGLFLLLVFALYASGITTGVVSEGTDWAMYVMHARNIVTGHAYADTGYVVQPETVRHEGATTYPSGYPLLLAPFYAVFGLNIHVFKLLNDALLAMALWPIFYFARRTLPVVESFLLIAGLAFSPLYLSVHNMIGSDAPYQVLSFLVLLMLSRVYDQGWADTASWKWGLLAGVLIAAAYLIRPIGMAFLISIAGLELARKRRPTAFLIAVFVAFVPLLLLNNLLFHKDAGYSDQFVLSIPVIASHAVSLIKLFSAAFVNPVSHAVRFLLWGVTLVLALLGFANRIRKQITVAEFYVVTVLGVLSAYWIPNARYLVPILPIYMVYAFEGFRALLAYVPPRPAPVLAGAAILLWLFPAAANVTSIRSAAADTLVTAPLYEQMCQVLRDKTASKELFVFWNPRVLVLSTGRQASDYPQVVADGLIAYLKRIRPNYIVLDQDHPEDQQYLIPALQAAQFESNTIYQNRQFRLVRILDSPRRAIP